MPDRRHLLVLGCGWLGLPLAAALVQAGHRVTGTTTSPEKQPQLIKAGVEPLLLSLSPTPTAALPACPDAVVLAFPPSSRRQGPEFHARQMQGVLSLFTEQKPPLVYVSSTGVYPEADGLFMENSPLQPGHPVARAEAVLRAGGHPLTVVRMGGLMGGDRVGIKYFSGKPTDQGDAPVNFIHRDDAVGILLFVLEKGFLDETFNAVAPQHPTRRKLYTAQARRLEVPPPQFTRPAAPPPQRLVSSEKIQAFGYRFQRSDPMDF